MIVRALLIYSRDFTCVLKELGYVLICYVKEKEKNVVLKNALVEKSESSTRNKNGLVKGL